MTYCMDEYMNGVSFGDISCDQNPSSSQNFISEIFLPYPQILLRMMIMATDLDWVCGKGSTDILLWIQFLRLCLPPTDPPLFAMLTHISPFIFHSLLGFMKRIYTKHLHEYIYLFSHIQTECLQTVTILHPSLFLVIIQGFVAYIYHILYFSML